MYVDRLEVDAALGAGPGVEAALRRLAGLARAAVGGQGASLLRSYGRPDHYTLLSWWDERDAALAFGASGAEASLARELRAGGLGEPVTHLGYEVPIVEGAESQAGCLQLADWELSSIGRAAEYEASRRELFALQRQHNPGFSWAQLLRSGGTPTRFCMVIAFASREAAQGGNRAPEVGEFVAQHPASKYANTPPAIEFHAVQPLG
jgi:heme-degrading monooxygenase HmoA